MFLGQRFKNSAQIRAWVSRLKLKTPFWGPFNLKIEIARFARTLELLLRSGIPILRAIQITIPVLDNDLMKEQFQRVHKDLAGGSSLGASLRRVQFLPVLVSDLIVVGEEAGTLTEIFHDIANSYEQETRDQISVMTTLLEPLMILTIGLVVGFVVFAMLLPIFQVDVFSR